MKISRIPLTLVAVALLSSCAVAAPKPLNPAVGIVEEFMSAYNAKNVEKLVSLYASDAIVVSEAGIAQGHEAIEARLSAGVKKGNIITELHHAKDESSGTLSYTEGSADITSGNQHLRRRYLVVVRTIASHSQIILHYSLPAVERTAGPQGPSR